MIDVLEDELKDIEFASDEDIEDASFEELILYLQTLNTVESALYGDKKEGEEYGNDSDSK